MDWAQALVSVGGNIVVAAAAVMTQIVLNKRAKDEGERQRDHAIFMAQTERDAARDADLRTEHLNQTRHRWAELDDAYLQLAEVMSHLDRQLKQKQWLTSELQDFISEAQGDIVRITTRMEILGPSNLRQAAQTFRANMESDLVGGLVNVAQFRTDTTSVLDAIRDEVAARTPDSAGDLAQS